MSTTFNTLDLIFFAFTAIFVLTAVFRGFIKEIFSFFNWILALAISYFLTPYISDFFSPYFESKLAIDLVSRSSIFILIFLIFSFSTTKFRDSLDDKVPTVFNRSLGLLFGLAKTLIIFGAIYSIYLNAYTSVMKSKVKEEPEWFRQAKSRSLIKTSGEMIDPLVRKFFDAVMKNFDQVLPKPEDLLNEKIDEILKEKSAESVGGEANSKTEESSRSLTDKELEESLDTGYSRKNIEKLNQLMEIINK
ncbi:MAG: CvpA family protein [Proteobacteria bacterium]|nr:CvpA family protein [Pseudomonadota bacterium]